MPEDVVRSLGYLCLGSRLKRIGEQLQADAQQLLDELAIPVQASQYPLLAALDKLGPLTVGDLALAVGVTQPAVTRSLSQLTALGVVDVNPATDDQRRKIASLTRVGSRLVETAKKDVWPRIEGAVADLCTGLSGPLLDQLTVLEAGLAAAPLARRAAKARGVAR